MTSSSQPITPAFQRELDPLLLLPVRLFIACLLADMRWRDDVTVQGVLRLSERKFAPHVERLRAAGYVETLTKGRRVELRLTTLGLDRLTEHVKALDKVASMAAELVSRGAQHSGRSTRCDKRSADGPKPCAEDL
ncbi:transcriptional regulator [Amycolatopsis sp. SID8362]|uniref:transcriptional regulator n=1 Tax=Amycolatopsis sp. SID8362 TaxID=2690346 RepID=UPI001EF2C342|nr:transcriptional regulator [Amycolatopsis sp. SID8362]